MPIGACIAGIRQAPGELLRMFDFGGFGELALSVVILSIAFTVLAAPFARAAYRRRVTRFMSFREVRQPPPAWWQRREHPGRRSAPPPGAGTDATPEVLADAMRDRRRRIRRATLAAYAAFVAGIALVLPLHPSKDATGLVIGAAAFAIGPAFINATPRRGLGLVTLLVAVALTVTVALDPEVDASDMLIGLGLVLAFQVVSTGRTLRALSVPLTLIALGAAAGMMLGALVGVTTSICVGRVPGSDQANYIMTATVLPTIALGGWVGTRLVAAVARAHEHGWVSDISLVSLFGLSAAAAMITFSADREGDTLAMMTAAFLVWIALPVSAYALVLWRSREPAAARSLLMLRVFSRHRRSERLLDRLQTSWRYVGPVLQIGGPDLARLNVDPAEFAYFLSGKSHDMFVPHEVPKEQLLASLDLDADREGRFRVVEVFCFDTAWHGTVQTLIESSDAILLDLRGFGPQRAGTAFELAQLVSRQRLDRTVVIGDHSTDWTYFETVAGAASGQIVRLDAHRADLVDACIAALMRCGAQRAA